MSTLLKKKPPHTKRKSYALWATTRHYEAPWKETLVHIFSHKPRKTKAVPWYHTKGGACAWLTPEEFTRLTGEPLPPVNELVRLDLKVRK